MHRYQCAMCVPMCGGCRNWVHGDVCIVDSMTDRQVLMTMGSTFVVLRKVYFALAAM